MKTYFERETEKYATKMAVLNSALWLILAFGTIAVLWISKL